MIFEGFYGLLVIHIGLSEFSDLGSARFRPKGSKRMDFNEDQPNHNNNNM